MLWVSQLLPVLSYGVVCMYVGCMAHETADLWALTWGLPDFTLKGLLDCSLALWLSGLAGPLPGSSTYICCWSLCHNLMFSFSAQPGIGNSSSPQVLQQPLTLALSSTLPLPLLSGEHTLATGAAGLTDSWLCHSLLCQESYRNFLDLQTTGEPRESWRPNRDSFCVTALPCLSS